ncbi:CBS domain-containing protein [Thermoplasmatales archaeon SW_10_69_26]|nr:MAG: CBS domain-containing protein [Thermoplasmatales archaeon SW_10_69_26]
MSVQDIARDRVVTADPHTAAEQVARQLKEANVGCVVVTEDGQPSGLVTDRDLVTRVVANLGAASGLTAGDIMTPEVATIEADQGIFELTELMRRQGIRRVPVVDGGDLDGIVTLDDVHRLLTTELSNLAHVIEKESPA